MKILTAVTSVLLSASILSLSSSLYASDLATSNISGKQIAMNSVHHKNTSHRVNKSPKGSEKPKTNNLIPSPMPKGWMGGS